MAEDNKNQTPAETPAKTAAAELTQEAPLEAPKLRKSPEKPQKQGVKYMIRDLLSVVIAAVVIAAVLKLFVVDSRLVPSASMEPTIMTGDRVIITKFSYYFGNLPDHGDVIVFNTGNEFEGEEDLLKRIIGLPGDTIEIRDNQTFVNGQPLDEPYTMEPPVYQFGPLLVPDGCYFVLGDNRNRSRDSHLWDDPFITKSDIKGKVVLIYWPLSEFGTVH